MNAGDHIFVNRTGYSHHGLYIGNDEVIHYEGASLEQRGGLVCWVSLQEFSAGDKVYVQSYPFRVFDAGDSVLRAKEQLGAERYNLAFNNCEHFVCWCIMGISFSQQVFQAASSMQGVGSLVGKWFRMMAEEPAKQELFRRALLQAGASQRLVGQAVKAVAAKGAGKAILGLGVGGTGSMVTTGGIAGSGLMAGASTTLISAPVLIPAALLAGGVLFCCSETVRDVVEDICEAIAAGAEKVWDGLEDVGWAVGDATLDGIISGFDTVEDVLCGAVDTVSDFCSDVADFFGW